MTTLLCYSRNRSTSVEALDDTTLVSTCRLQDTRMDAVVQLRIRLPELEITAAEGRFFRPRAGACSEIDTALQKMIGIRIGAGLKKIIRGLTAETSTCRALPTMLEESCHAVILAFTKDTLAAVPKETKASIDYFKAMVKKNIRLYDRCAAFAPGSPLVEGMDPP